jgi:hypothetical protein
MSNILQGGQLRERVKSGAVSAKDARQALLALRAEGIRWRISPQVAGQLPSQDCGPTAEAS